MEVKYIFRRAARHSIFLAVSLFVGSLMFLEDASLNA